MKVRISVVLTICFLLHPICLRAFCHSSRLSHLEKKGFNPQVIYDIGAFQGEWSAAIQKIFPNASFFLFEANDYNVPFLNRFSFPFFITVLGDRQGTATFYSINGGSGDSLLREQTSFYLPGTCREIVVQVNTLNNMLQEHKLPLPDLIKMDVQGAEKLIMEGGESIVCHAEVIILETKILEYNKGAPLIFEMLCYMDRLGYQVSDILEVHYVGNEPDLNEVDLLFIRKESSLIRRGLLDN